MATCTNPLYNEIQMKLICQLSIFIRVPFGCIKTTSAISLSKLYGTFKMSGMHKMM